MRPDSALRAASQRCSYPLHLFLHGNGEPSRIETPPPERNRGALARVRRGGQFPGERFLPA